MRILTFIFCVFSIFPNIAFGLTGVSISIKPEKIIQGDPVMATFSGVKNISNIKSVYLNKTKLDVLNYQNKPVAFFGVDLYKNPGDYILTANFSDGTAIEKKIKIEERLKVEEPLGIPEKLGGNTPASQKKLVDTLAAENQSLLDVVTSKKSFWSEKFRYPINNPIVTDSYGYTRKTGSYSIAHKGVDFKAKEGTKIFAVNKGVVRLVKEYRNYGKTVVIDHGLGLMSFYMHLSKINVKVGESVKSGQVIGLSGQTGYAESPHLHFTFRIKNISIDPIRFLDFFK